MNEELRDQVEGIILTVLRYWDNMRQLCEYLDSCYDLHDLGLVDEVRQAVLIQMSELRALELWACFEYVHTGNPDFEYTFKVVVDTITKSVEGKVII